MEKNLLTLDNFVKKIDYKDELIEDKRIKLRFLFNNCASCIIQAIRLNSPVLLIGFFNVLKRKIKKYEICEEKFCAMLKALCDCLNEKYENKICIESNRIIELSTIILSNNALMSRLYAFDTFKDYREEYLKLALKKEKEKAFEFIKRLIKEGISIKEIYLKQRCPISSWFYVGFRRNYLCGTALHYSSHSINHATIVSLYTKWKQ
ncbi:hypothetical protein [Thermodesulfovibrio hydrogeniphilus]